MTRDESDYIRYIDEVDGCNCGLLLYKGDPIAFSVGMNEWLREAEYEDECKSCEEVAENKNAKYIESLEGKIASIDVIECECGYHTGVDSSYIDQVDGVTTKCPACGKEIVYGYGED